MEPTRLDQILADDLGATKFVSRAFWFFLGRLSQKEPPPAQGMECLGCSSTQQWLSPKAHLPFFIYLKTPASYSTVKNEPNKKDATVTLKDTIIPYTNSHSPFGDSSTAFITFISLNIFAAQRHHTAT